MADTTVEELPVNDASSDARRSAGLVLGPLEEAYPRLYVAADKYAIKEQRLYYCGLFFQLLLLFLAVVMSVINDETPFHAIVLTVLLLALFSLSAYLMFARTVDRWYAARALAESIKTRSWRFMMKAVPYGAGDEEAELHFAEDISELARKQATLLPKLAQTGESVPVNKRLIAVRKLSPEERGSLYYASRVQDQHEWYHRKTRIKAAQGRLFSILFLVSVLVALVVALMRIAAPSNPVWPIDALISIATAILTWIQSKKFAELKATYKRAAEETRQILDGWPKAPTEAALIRSVADTESVFSQEHTRWAARKDL